MLLVLFTAGGAAATTLGDLQGSFLVSLDGTLRFENFDTVITGILDTDPVGDEELEDYKVIALDDGFRIVGPMGAADGNRGDIVINYDVVAVGVPGVIEASLFFNGAIIGEGALAAVSEDLVPLENGEPFDDLFVGVTGGNGGSLKFDETSFDFGMTL